MSIKDVLIDAKGLRNILARRKEDAVSEQQRIADWETYERQREVQQYLDQIKIEELERRYPTLLR